MLRQLYKWGIKWSEIALVFAFLFSVRYHLSCNIKTNRDLIILISSTLGGLFHRLFEIALAPCHTFIVLIGCSCCFVCGLRDDSYRTK